MQYELIKSISGIRIKSKTEKERAKVLIDYTITGTATHNGTELPVNEGISIEIDLPEELAELADALADEQIENKYKND